MLGQEMQKGAPAGEVSVAPHSQKSQRSRVEMLRYPAKRACLKLCS